MPNNQTPPNGGNHNSGQGWQYNYNSGGPRKPQKDDPPGWVPIIIFFALGCGMPFFFIPAIVMLVKKLQSLSPQDRSRYSQEFRSAAESVRDVAKETRQEFRKAAGDAKQNVRTATPNPAPEKKTKTAKKRTRGSAGMVRIILGAIFTGSFAIALFDSSIDLFRSLFYGNFFTWMLTNTFVLALFLIGSLALLFNGISSRKEQARFMGYLGYIGANREVNLAHMAAAFDIPVKNLCKDLRKMLAKGVLPSGYLDLAAGKLFLTEMGARAPEPEPAEEPVRPKAEREDDEVLQEIRMVNDQIPDEVMTGKIHRIEEITGKILAYQKSHPDRSSELRSFLNYYLPTTLKILRAYAQLDAQGIEGENITAAKTRIEGMMDQVVNGFEKQLDKLFHDDAMDITSDVQVLENMLKKDGLSDDDQGMTMTL